MLVCTSTLTGRVYSLLLLFIFCDSFIMLLYIFCLFTFYCLFVFAYLLFVCVRVGVLFSFLDFISEGAVFLYLY